jgi:nucleolar complex protein 3
MTEFKSIVHFMSDKRTPIKRLVFLTLLAIYKDIVPGYRIRKLTAKELAVQVSKDVRKVRDFEEALLAGYQSYLQSLENVAQKTLRENGDRLLLQTVVQCMSQLLISVGHFNFRSNLINAVVSKMAIKKFPEISKICCDTIRTLFENDEYGEVSLECMKVLSKLFLARKDDLPTYVIETLLFLRLEGTVIAKNEIVEGSLSKKRKSKDAHISKRMKKFNKYQSKIDAELKEAEATYDKAEISKFVMTINLAL